MVLNAGKSALLPSTVQEMVAFGLAPAWHSHVNLPFLVEQTEPDMMDGESEKVGDIIGQECAEVKHGEKRKCEHAYSCRSDTLIHSKIFQSLNTET